MEAEPDPVSSALREADHLGWLLYADKMDLREGRWAKVGRRVAERARSRRLLLVGAPVLTIPNIVLSIGDEKHGLLGPIAGFTLLGMMLAYALFLAPRLWRTYSQIERALGRLPQSQ